MNSKALAIAVVAICIIAPLIGGYLMPNDDYNAVGYEIDGTKTITSTLPTTAADVGQRNTSYLNNFFMFESVAYGNNNDTGSYTTIPTNYPELKNITLPNSSSPTQSFSLEGSEIAEYVQTENNNVIGIDWNKVVCYWLEPSEGFVIHTMDGRALPYTVVEYLEYYPGIDLVIGRYSLDTAPILAYSDIRYTSTSGTITMGVIVQPFTIPSREDTYLDISNGLITTSGSGVNSYWMNGSHNLSVSLIVSADTTTRITPYYTYTTPYGCTVRTYTTTDSIGVVVLNSSNETLERMTFPNDIGITHYLINFNARSSEIAIYALVKMESFISSSYNIYASKTVTLDFDMTTIDSVLFSGASSESYYVPGTIIASGLETTVLDNVEMTLSTYQSSFGAFRFQSIAAYGDSITIEVGSGHTYTFAVLGGKINVPIGNDQYATIPVDGLIAALIPVLNPNDDENDYYTLALNGYSVDNIIEPTSSLSLTVTLDGYWLLDVGVAEITTFTYTAYTWLAGSFNIDQTTFCTFGMFAAFTMAVICGLYAYREGEGVILPLIVAGGCGFIYLLLLL